MITPEKIKEINAKNDEYRDGYIEGLFDAFETLITLEESEKGSYTELLVRYKNILSETLEEID